MRLFPGFLLFFKDARQRRSCRMSHQSPPPLPPPPPALCLISYSLTFANAMKQREPIESTQCVSHAFDEGTPQTRETRRVLAFFSRLFPEDARTANTSSRRSFHFQL